MKNLSIKWIAVVVIAASTLSCKKFLDKTPLDTPTLETYWSTPDQAKLWVNNLYLALGAVETESIYEAFSDNAYGRAGSGANNIANGTFETIDSRVAAEWDYRYIRLCHLFFENVGKVPGLSATDNAQLSAQVKFILAYRYYKLITFFRDVPLVTSALPIEDADMPKSPKAEVLAYILKNLDEAIATLPPTWPAADNGRVTKGAALALKARVQLYNNLWTDAAATAKQIMDSKVYALHPRFNELFLTAFNNATKEVILARQYAAVANTHDINLRYGPVLFNGQSLILPTVDLEQAYEMKDGLPKSQSPLWNPQKPFDNRDPRFAATLMWQGQVLNGQTLDLTGTERSFAFTYLYYRKYIGDFKDRLRPSNVNWILFRYAEVFLTYAEAKNEATGPDATVYSAIDSVRLRAGMPVVDRVKYATQATLRDLIRNERRVELAGEGLRYFDVIRWRIGPAVMNKTVKSMDLSLWVDGPKDAQGRPVLVEKNVQVRVFNPAKHYVWPIPQTAIDRSKKLVQHDEWK